MGLSWRISLVKLYYCAHYKERQTLKFCGKSEKIDGGEGVQKCIIFYVDSILGVHF